MASDRKDTQRTRLVLWRVSLSVRPCALYLSLCRHHRRHCHSLLHGSFLRCCKPP
jgi:hypothetical protein